MSTLQSSAGWQTAPCKTPVSTAAHVGAVGGADGGMEETFFTGGGGVVTVGMIVTKEPTLSSAARPEGLANKGSCQTG